jgi:hypothetical protein
MKKAGSVSAQRDEELTARAINILKAVPQQHNYFAERR